jgi:SAM-dependent methyltransferase
MLQSLPPDGTYDLHEAQNETRNYLARHRTNRDRLGVFRWRGMQKHLDLILEKISPAGVAVLDFGGAACPLGFGSKIVDQLKHDAYGRPVEYHSIDTIPNPVDVIFTSHTLEHIEPLEAVLKSFAEKLKTGGYLLAHVPSYTCDRWWPGVHSNDQYHDHVWCFGLCDNLTLPGLSRYRRIDELVATALDVELAEFCGDDSIFLVARSSGKA